MSATQPFASLEHLLARLLQAQVYRALEAGNGGLVDRPEVGAHLLRTLVSPGSTRPWQETVVAATGQPLGAAACLDDELGLGGAAGEGR